MSLNENKTNFENAKPIAPRALKRRRVSMFRKISVFALTATALILFVFWYREIPQGMDCLRMTQKITTALSEYHSEHHKLPPVLDALNVPKGRYGIDHYEYWFIGFGGPAYLPSGTVIAYCSQHHDPLFASPWRNVILMVDGKIIATTLSEEAFQKAIKNQPSAEKYLTLHINSKNTQH